ncbi:hypothetical protein SAMN06265348_10291 [Pedobacter westerhofensis]|uniref:Uncharacterized protein n=2 Tax=Pedobacter westerhofensis TaxID=425512 RepID=A0A521B8B6_9SPHI|nr:hypothetical protein SAMN06265348_10291 [Pedobacter westerhofensis]
MIMSIRKGGIFKGKKGNTVTYEVNGQVIQRTIGKREKPYKDHELGNQSGFGKTSVFMRPVKQFIKNGFELQGKKKFTIGYNMAVGYNRMNAIEITSPNSVRFVYEKALFSQGAMTVNPEATVKVVEGGLEFRWDAGLMAKGMKRNDHAMLLAYCPEKESAFFELSGANRKTGRDFLEITAYHQPVTLEVYIAFEAADRKSISNSVYLGQVQF